MINDGHSQSPVTERKPFPPTFWFANLTELFERAAYYGMFITLNRYLNQDIGFNDFWSAIISGNFPALMYFLPMFAGLLADRIGFRKSLIMAFALLTVGYALLGFYQLKATVIIALLLIAAGGATIKPCISGTAAHSSTGETRARAMSIFYMVVNIGSFSGKMLAGVLNENMGLQAINYYASGMSLVGLLVIIFFYRNIKPTSSSRSITAVFEDLWNVIKNLRFLILVLIAGGFWMLQGQMYISMPTFIERVIGKGYKPEWLANINPLVVVLLAVPITHLMRKLAPTSSIGLGLLIIPLSMLCWAWGFQARPIDGQLLHWGSYSIHPTIIYFAVGIALMGLAECCMQPRFLEFVSKQAPPGKEGLYLGFQNLNSCISWIFNSLITGILLASFCPNPNLYSLEFRHQWRQATNPRYYLTLTEPLGQQLPHDNDDPVLLSSELINALHTQWPELDDNILVTKDAKSQAPDELIWNLSIHGERYQIKSQKIKITRPNGEIAQWKEYLLVGLEARQYTVPPQLPAEYARAHHIWYVFIGIGIATLTALIIYKLVTERIDRLARARGQ
ncbi:MAG: Dipeptide and tripeptide permease B [Phycisphaerae bacterium]|nr:Dipeptide and tripeptide permease B [Phycisphaerae bacterium]